MRHGKKTISKYTEILNEIINLTKGPDYKYIPYRYISEKYNCVNAIMTYLVRIGYLERKKPNLYRWIISTTLTEAIVITFIEYTWQQTAISSKNRTIYRCNEKENIKQITLPSAFLKLSEISSAILVKELRDRGITVTAIETKEY
jgi:hypothetical protein